MIGHSNQSYEILDKSYKFNFSHQSFHLSVKNTRQHHLVVHPRERKSFVTPRNMSKTEEEGIENKFFDDFIPNENILRGIYSYGYEKPSPIQRMTIPLITTASRRDAIIQSRTGTGKTGSICLSILQNVDFSLSDVVQAIVLCPTRELAQGTFSLLKALGTYTELKPMCLVGGTNIKDCIGWLQNGVNVVVYMHLQRSACEIHSEFGILGNKHFCVREVFIGLSPWKSFFELFSIWLAMAPHQLYLVASSFE